MANDSFRDEHKVNRQIRAVKISVIDPEGVQRGEMTVDEGIQLAREYSLDLVEVAGNANPPVCKIMDYGKHKFEAQKKKSAAKKKQKVISIKEVKVRPGIEENDYQVKLRNARRFIADGDKVKVTLRFRGREIAHHELGFKVLTRIREDLGEDIKVELHPKREGRQLIMILTPAKT